MCDLVGGTTIFLTPISHPVEHIHPSNIQNVQILRTEKAHDPKAKKEVEIERQLLVRLVHPNIVAILGCGEAPQAFMVLERLKPVEELLNLGHHTFFKRNPFPFEKVVTMAVELADALDYLHQEVHADAMIIHRNVKPNNLGISDDNHVKLFDFRMARCVRKRHSERETYEFDGIPNCARYCAPELFLGQRYDEKVDVYGYSMTLWTLLTGRVVFDDLDRTAVRQKVIIDGERPKLSASWSDDFCDIIDACWHYDPLMRPCFAEVKLWLTSFVSSGSSSPASSGSSLRRLSLRDASAYLRGIIAAR
jgi:serine/threonine protein kinase